MLAQYLAREVRQEVGSTYLDAIPLEHFLQHELHTIKGPAVIKAHGLGPRAMSLLHTGRAKAVCTLRDPRDCVASDLMFLKKDINFSIRRVMDNMQCLNNYEGGTHTLFVQYEQMMANPLKQIVRIAGHLGVDADESILRQIEVGCSIPASKAAIEVLKKKDPKTVIWHENHRVDPGNHLHENHIHDARVGKWKDFFTQSQAERLAAIFRPWLVKYGYEVPQSLEQPAVGSTGISSSTFRPMPAMA
jgi:hypothetical protein